MKVCYLNYYNPLEFRGGAERVVLREAELVAERGNEVVIITTHSGEDVKGKKIVDGKIKAWFLPRIHSNNGSLAQKCTSLIFSFHNPLLTRHIDRILRMEKPDVVHVHNSGAISINVVNVAKQIGCHVVQTFHGYNFECPKGSLYRKSGVLCSNPPAICRIYKQIFRSTMQKSDHIIAICSYVRQRLIHARYNHNRITLIPNSLQRSHEASLPRAEHKEILFVGRMLKAKGVHVFINALEKIKRTCEDEFSVNLIGDGPDKAYFESLAQSLDVNVNFLGNVPDAVLREYYKKAYAVVVPSLFPELFPMVVLEAMSHGKPVIASNIGGLPDLVLHRQTGLLFEPNNVDALAECIKHLLNDEELTVNLGHKAFELSAKFSDANHLNKLLELYSKIVLQRSATKHAK